MNKKGFLGCAASDHDPEIKQCAHILPRVKAAHWREGGPATPVLVLCSRQVPLARGVMLVLQA